MKKIVSLVLFLSLAFYGFANDVFIYLNNGNCLEGDIVTENNTQVTVLKKDGTTQVLSKIEIRKISDQPEELPAFDAKNAYVDYSKKETGFWCAVELGSGYNIFSNPDYSGSVLAELDLTAGYIINKYLRVGAGAGVKYYFGDKSRINAIDGKTIASNFSVPVFANFRGLIIDDKSRTTVPFWSANIGYTINDGFYFSPCVGLRFGSTARNHFTLSLGYLLQRITRVDKSSNVFNSTLNAVELKIGYQF